MVCAASPPQAVTVAMRPQISLPEMVQSIVQAGGRVLEVREEQHTLEEVYLNLVKEEAKE